MRRFETTGEVSHVRDGYRAGTEIACDHIGRLHEFEALPANGFGLACFAVKIGGQAGPERSQFLGGYNSEA